MPIRKGPFYKDFVGVKCGYSPRTGVNVAVKPRAQAPQAASTPKQTGTT